jgi:hypothetical protein
MRGGSRENRFVSKSAKLGYVKASRSDRAYSINGTTGPFRCAARLPLN